MVLAKESPPGPERKAALAVNRREICTDFSAVPVRRCAFLNGIRGCRKFRAFRFACTPWAIIPRRDVGDAVPYKVLTERSGNHHSTTQINRP